MRTTPASSNDTFSMLAAEVRRAPTERLATMTLYRAVDAWCAQQNRPPVQLLFLHVTNASSSSDHPRTYTIQTSSPRTVHAALCAILPECFEGTPVLNRMVGVDVHPAIKSDTPTWATHQNGKSNLGLYVSTDAKESPPLSLAQTMLCASCPLLTVHDGHITNVSMRANFNEIIRKGTQWADVYHTLQNKPIPT